MTLYGYARVSVREPEDKNLDLQVESAWCAPAAPWATSGPRRPAGPRTTAAASWNCWTWWSPGDTLVVTHIDRLSRGLTYGLQVIEGLHHAGVEFRSLAEDFDTATANGKLQLQMVLAFSEWWRNSIRERSIAGQAKARTEGRFPGRTAQPDRAATGVHLAGPSNRWTGVGRMRIAVLTRIPCVTQVGHHYSASYEGVIDPLSATRYKSKSPAP